MVVSPYHVQPYIIDRVDNVIKKFWSRKAFRSIDHTALFDNEKIEAVLGLEVNKFTIKTK